MKIEYKDILSQEEFDKLNELFITVSFVEMPWNEDKEITYKEVEVDTLHFKYQGTLNHFVINWIQLELEKWYKLVHENGKFYFVR